MQRQTPHLDRRTLYQLRQLEAMGLIDWQDEAPPILMMPSHEELGLVLLRNLKKSCALGRSQGHDLVEAADVIAAADKVIAAVRASERPKAPPPPYRWREFDWRDKRQAVEELLAAGAAAYRFRFIYDDDADDKAVEMIQAIRELAVKAADRPFVDYLEKAVEDDPFEDFYAETDSGVPTPEHTVERVL